MYVLIQKYVDVRINYYYYYYYYFIHENFISASSCALYIYVCASFFG
jgi:hypothetical protein